MPIPPYVPQNRYFVQVPAHNRQGHTLTGDIRVLAHFHSRYLKTDRDVLVYLPPGYEQEPHRHYPVLYLQDGQNLFDGATSFIPGQEWRVDETAESLIHQGQIEPLIVVAIYNAGKERINEYTPTKDAGIRQGGKARLYGKMLVEELKPLVDSHYRTKPDAASTGVGGSSLGGLLSLYLGLTYPKVFGNLAILSPSIWWNKRDIVQRFQELHHKLPLRIWLDTGTNEGGHPDMIIADARNLAHTLETKGWQLGHDLAYTEAQGAPHSESAWATRMPDVLRFLYPAH